MRLFRSATPAEKDAWLSLGIALCRESDIFIGLLVGRVFVLSEVTNARMYNFKTEEKELAAMLVQMEKSRAGRSPSMSEIRGVATANISHLIDEDADPYYALLAYPLIAAAISLALVGLVAWTPWRMPTAHWSIPILVSFMGTLIFGASRFSLDRWLVYMGWESGNGIWRYVEVPCFLIWFVAVGHVIFQKWRVRRDFQGLVVVLLGAFLFGVSQSILPEAIAIPTVMALTALIGQKQEGGIHPWVSALQLTILMLLFQVAQQSSPPFLTVGIAAAALLSVSQPKTTTSWSLGFGLVLLFSGLAAGRWFDHRAMSWLEADQRRMAEFRAQLPK